MAAGGDVGAQFLKTAYTFRRFTHNYLLSLHHSLKGPDGSLALDVMARSLAYAVFLAGIPALMGIDISGSLKTGIPLIGAGTPQDTIYGVYGGMAKKALNAMSAVERENYLRALEFASPAFIEAVLKAYRMSETGVTMPRGKIITDEQGKPIRMEAGEGIAQAAGFRPERLARISGEHWTMENVQKHFKEKKDDLYSRYRLAKSQEDRARVIRDMQKFNMDARKYPGLISPITATSLRRATLQRLEKATLAFRRMMEANP